MNRIKLSVFFLALSIASAAQNPTPTQPQLTQIPPKPTCNPAALPLFGGGADCREQWNFYNQAVQARAREEIQLYVTRQKELASAPLQQQISDLTKLSADQQAHIQKLQAQMQLDFAAAMQAKSDAHVNGLREGTAFGAGAMSLLLLLSIGIKKLASGLTITKKPLARSASA